MASSTEQIERLADEIGARFDPERVILFGSPCPRHRALG